MGRVTHAPLPVQAPAATLRAALRLATRGLYVFPVSGKAPAIAGGSGHLDASNEPAVIRRLWRNGSRITGVGVSLDASGLVAVDLDAAGAELAELMDVLELPRTVTAATPSGGRHYLYRLPADVEARRVIRHDGRPVDVLGKGYVVAPPGDGRTWLTAPGDAELAPPPAWVTAALTPPEPSTAAPRRPVTPTDPDRAEAYVGSVIDGEAERVAGLSEGQRNVETYRAACRIGRVIDLAPHLEASARDAIEAAAAANGVLADDGAHAIRSAVERGLEWGRQHPRELPDDGTPYRPDDLDAPSPRAVRSVAADALESVTDDVAALDDCHPNRRPSVLRVHTVLLRDVLSTGRLDVRRDVGSLALDADAGKATVCRAADALHALGWRIQWGGVGEHGARCTVWTWCPDDLSERLERSTPDPDASHVPPFPKGPGTEVGHDVARGVRRRDKRADLAGVGGWAACVIDLAVTASSRGLSARDVSEALGVTVRTGRNYLSRLADRGLFVIQTEATAGRPVSRYIWAPTREALKAAEALGARARERAEAALAEARDRMRKARDLVRRGLASRSLRIALAWVTPRPPWEPDPESFGRVQPWERERLRQAHSAVAAAIEHWDGPGLDGAPA